MNKVTNLTLPSGETVEIQDSHAITLDENTSISGTFDFGKVTGAGNYNVPLNALNGPSGVSVTTGTLKVLYDNNKPIQIYLHRVTNQIFVRSLGDNGSWNSWVDITATNSLNSSISSLSSRINAEVTNRQSGDASLQTQITTNSNGLTTEVATRKSADNTLSTAITTETNERKSEDTAIRNTMTGIDTRLADEESITNLSGVPSSINLFSGSPISSQNTQASILCLHKHGTREGYYYGLIFAQGQLTISNMSANTQYNVNGSTNFTLNGKDYTFQTRSIATCTSMHQYSGVFKIDYAGSTSHLYSNLAISGLTVNFSLVIPIIFSAV